MGRGGGKKRKSSQECGGGSVIISGCHRFNVIKQLLKIAAIIIPVRSSIWRALSAFSPLLPCSVFLLLDRWFGPRVPGRGAGTPLSGGRAVSWESRESAPTQEAQLC